jgi:drug/metabolite transporter (DMT)-like permease
MRHPTEAAGLAFAVAAAAAFGTLGISAKLAYRAGADPFPVLAVRFLLTALILGASLSATGRWATLEPGKVVRLLLLGGIGYALESALFFLALERSPAGTVAFIFYSYPVWTLLMALAARLERFTWRLVIPLVLAATGISIIFSFSISGGLIGPLLALSAAFGVAIYFVLAQVVAAGVPPAISALWTSTGAALSLTLTWFVVGGSLPAGGLAPITGLAVATVVAFVFFFAAMERLGSARVSIASTFEPVTTVILAAIVLGEALSLRFVFGGVLVLSAIPILAASSLSGSRTGAP